VLVDRLEVDMLRLGLLCALVASTRYYHIILYSLYILIASVLS
jgi:hypothetical protein